MKEMTPKENKVAENSEEIKGSEKQQRGWRMGNYVLWEKQEKEVSIAGQVSFQRGKTPSLGRRSGRMRQECRD